jgi:hypothetical protein
MNMTTRLKTTTVTFERPFHLDEIERELPAGSYEVETAEERIDGASFLTYRRVSTSILLRAGKGARGSARMWRIHPDGLESALERDKAGA